MPASPTNLVDRKHVIESKLERDDDCSPKRVVNDSAASRNSDVGMALPLEESTGTSTKDFLRVSNHVPPGGIAA